MSTSDLERRIRSWYADEIGGTEAAPTSLESFLATVPVSVPQEQGLFGRRMVVLLAAALLVGLVAGTIAVGSGLIKLPSLLPLPSLMPEASVEPTPSISVEPSPGESLGLVAYTVQQLVDPPPVGCTPPQHPWCSVERIWVANSDGTGAHELLPDVPDNQRAIAWSPDGSQLLYADADGLALAVLAGAAPGPIPHETLCPADNCPSLDGFAFSPDGKRLAYVAMPGNQPDTSVIAIYDLTARQVTVLESTRTQGLELPCITSARQGENAFPSWSADGTQLVFTRMGIGPLNETGNCRHAVLVVNADGTGLRVIVASDGVREPSNAHWSPDGSLIAYHSAETTPGSAAGGAAPVDIFVVNPDGAGARQLTDDGLSVSPTWTADGRIVFGRCTDATCTATELWIMDGDGGGGAQLQSDSLADLTAANCMVCPYTGAASEALWQPLP